jgi:hypothetical protein
MDVLAGTDFFTVEVLSWRGLVSDYVLFFTQLKTRQVTLAGMTRHPEALLDVYCATTWKLTHPETWPPTYRRTS